MSQDLNTSTATFLESATEPGPDQWLPSLLQCNDSSYPVGVFAHSFGLEAMVQCGSVSDPDSLLGFLEGPVEHGLAQVDLPLLAHARDAACHGDYGELVRLDYLSSACRAPFELREAASRIGRQRMEILRSVWSRHFNVPVLDLPCEQAPVVAGVEAHVLGVPKNNAMLAYAHGAFAAVLSAAVKLLRLGQTTVQQLLLECGRSLQSLIQTAGKVSLEDLGSFAPLLDTSSMRHERCPARLFLS